MTGLAQNEMTWSCRHDGGEVGDHDLIAPFVALAPAMREKRNDFILSKDIAIA